jgi:hypothetical protein
VETCLGENLTIHHRDFIGELGETLLTELHLYHIGVGEHLVTRQNFYIGALGEQLVTAQHHRDYIGVLGESVCQHSTDTTSLLHRHGGYRQICQLAATTSD